MVISDFENVEARRIITNYIQANFAPDCEISAKQLLRESGLIDSGGLLELLLFLEESFDLSIEDDEVLSGDFESIDALVYYVGRRLTSKTRATD